MKLGFRTPSVKKSVKARTTGRINRSVKKSVNPLYGKKGTGYITNPKKAVYDKMYNKTSFGAKDVYNAIDFNTNNNSNAYKSTSPNYTDVSTNKKRKKVQVPIGEHDTKLSERIFNTIIAVVSFVFVSLIIFWLFQDVTHIIQYIFIGIALIIAIYLIYKAWTNKKTVEFKTVFEDELTADDKDKIYAYKQYDHIESNKLEK